MAHSVTRLLVGLAAAAAVAVLAVRSRSLSRGGAVAATVVGTLAVGAGWSWGVLLLAFFVSSSALSRLGAATKDARVSGVVEKGGARDGVQVLANGGIFALAALILLVMRNSSAVPSSTGALTALGAGALAASASDTWATEVGTLLGGAPRSILSGRRVLPGTSGGVSLAGTLAALAGAAFVAAVAALAGWPPLVCMAAIVGGVIGSTLDSLLGATLQTRRWCEHCDRATERERHDCGRSTRHIGGMEWFGNDAVNAVSSAAGGLAAMLIALSA